MITEVTPDEGGAIVELPWAVARPVIAVGGELKNSICTVEGGKAAVGPPIGSLSSADNYRRFIRELNRAVERLTGRSTSRRVQPPVLAHDLHPTYLSTVAAWKLASMLGAAICEGVQHHHAHVVACLAEHGLMQPVVGIACDGAGYGPDGAIWGCEVLHVTPVDFDRCARLQYFPLPGGDAAARHTWRPALSLVHQAFGRDLPADVRKMFDRVPAVELNAVRSMLQSGFNCPPTSSLGRLFDAVAFLAGVCDVNESEGQAAMQLEAAAESGADRPYSFRLLNANGGDRRIVVSDMITEVCHDVGQGVSSHLIASRFHATVAEMLCQAALTIAQMHHIDTVVLTGGCFLNRILLERTDELLLQGDVTRVLRHERLSPGDASLSLGQAVTAAARLREKR